MADVQSTTAASRRSTKTSSTSSTNMSNNDTVAAMRHLRSIVQSIAMDENISPTQRTQKIQNFEQLLDKAEKQLHYKKDAGGAGVCELLDDPLNIKTTKQVVNAEVLKNSSSKNNNKKKNKEWKKKGWLKAGRLLGRQRVANKSVPGVGGGGESVTRLSTTYEGLEVDTRHETEVQRRDMALQNNDEETREETDSIIDIRDQNSYDYTASIESLRSLNTFEKDFINNVTAEHARMEAAAEDGNSVGTFEQDFVGPVRNNNNNNVYPTQVEQHQMYNDDAISETTFEADARSLEPLENQAVVGGQQGRGSVFVPQMPRMVQTTEHEEVEDDITVGTLENDERADNNVPPPQQQPNPVLNAWGSAPTTLTTFNNMVKTAFSADNSSSILSVSTFEKDTKAIQALAAKIGRTPSFKPKKSIPEELESVASDGTFEQDQKKRMRSQISPRMSTHHQDGMVLNNASEVSTSTFEKDMKVHQPKPHLSVIGEAASSKLGHSVSRQQSTAGNMGGGVHNNSVVSSQMMMHRAPVMHQPPHANAQVRPNDKSTQGWFGSSIRRGHENQDTGVISVHTPVTSKSNVITGPSPYTQIMNNRGKQETVVTDGAKAKLTKISPLAVELSPSTVDKGVKKKKAQSSGSLWDRFVCGI